MLQQVVDYFSSIPAYQRTLVLAGGFLLMWTLETAWPLFRNPTRKTRHAGINLFFTVTTLLVNFLFAVMLVEASDFTVQHRFGLLHLAKLPLWLHTILGLMLLDLIGAYLIHLLEHKVKWMWKFHIIHHTDPHVNATTALRHHPGESVFRASFTILAVLVAGVPIGIVMLYQSCSALLSQFNHANVKLPAWLDRAILWIFVSPDMHKVHHHDTMPVTDTNYGNIFSFWDRLFGTFLKKDVNELRYGLDIYRDEPDAQGHLPRLMKIPFEPYRPPSDSKFGK